MGSSSALNPERQNPRLGLRRYAVEQTDPGSYEELSAFKGPLGQRGTLRGSFHSDNVEA